MTNENRLEFYTDLISAQREINPATKSAKNAHFRNKYADLSSVLNACMDALNNNNLFLTQPLIVEHTETGVSYEVVTHITHCTGESISTSIPLILHKHDMQGLGAAITYARRYGLVTLLGIAQEDDDGNSIAIQEPKKKSKSINQEQLARIQAAQKFKGLNNWEKNYLQGLIDKLERYGNLFDGSFKKLQEIEDQKGPKAAPAPAPKKAKEPEPTIVLQADWLPEPEKSEPEPEPETAKEPEPAPAPESKTKKLTCPTGMTHWMWLDEYSKPYGGIDSIEGLAKTKGMRPMDTWTDANIAGIINGIESGQLVLAKVKDSTEAENE